MAGGTWDLLCLDLPHAEAVRAALPEPGQLDATSARAQALADPTRLHIAVALAQANEACVCDLAWITGRAQNLVSHHLRTLRSSGIAASKRQGRMVLYSLTSSGRKLVEAVLAGAEFEPTPVA
jgi:ArsR family transcriptional regulator, lead/cadmium/zinc/bismuth-responsive transcriptional repressor